MSIIIKKESDSISWQAVTELLNGFGLTDFTPQQTQFAFDNSRIVVFILDEGELIGCGRALSDGISQAAIYNIAVKEVYHHQGIGQLIISAILEEVSSCNVILYTHPLTVGWYEQQGFTKMKTGLARYHPEHLDKLREMSFI